MQAAILKFIAGLFTGEVFNLGRLLRAKDLPFTFATEAGLFYLLLAIITISFVAQALTVMKTAV
jgi:hypothetical protein